VRAKGKEDEGVNQGGEGAGIAAECKSEGKPDNQKHLLAVGIEDKLPGDGDGEAFGDANLPSYLQAEVADAEAASFGVQAIAGSHEEAEIFK